MEPIVLASASPRRRELLSLMGLPFTCVPSCADESFDKNAEPKATAEKLARLKVNKTLEILQNEPLWICGADTIVSLCGEIYGKPQNRNDARRMLKALEGNVHETVTGIALYSGRAKTIDSRLSVNAVTFAPMSNAEIDWYLDTGEWQDAAGGYKIQGLASCFIQRIEGSCSSIAGLPLREFYALLKDNGYPYGASTTVN